MTRSGVYDVLTLRVKPSGESNREAWFLGAQDGIFKATVFGGPKSKLRSQVSPFHQGKLWVYHDPVRDSRKVTDFDVQIWRPGLRELYGRTMAADSLAETVLATHAGGGAWEAALKLAGSVLDCLETSDEKNCRRILFHFFWIWTEFLGVRPDPGRCAGCACEVKGDGVLWYRPGEGSFFCSGCRDSHGPQEDAEIMAGPGARCWLTAVGNLDPKEALRYSLDTASMRQAGSLILQILAGALGKRLPLWDYWND